MDERDLEFFVDVLFMILWTAALTVLVLLYW